jgi:hypothetical protein
MVSHNKFKVEFPARCVDRFAATLKALWILLEVVEQLLQFRVTREKWPVSDQLICNLHQVRKSIYVTVSYEAVHLKSDV